MYDRVNDAPVGAAVGFVVAVDVWFLKREDAPFGRFGEIEKIDLSVVGFVEVLLPNVESRSWLRSIHWRAAERDCCVDAGA